MNILQINSSVRGNQSESTRVANGIVARLRAAHPEATLTVRDLAANPHPELDEATLGAAWRCWASAPAASTSSATLRACSSRLAPNSVSIRRRVVRCSSRSPTLASSSAMRRDTVDFGKSRRCAALLKLPASTMRANSSRSFGSTSIDCSTS